MQKTSKIESVTVSLDQYLDAVRESIVLAKTGVMRIVLLHGQADQAAILERSESLEDALSALVSLRNMPHQ